MSSNKLIVETSLIVVAILLAIMNTPWEWLLMPIYLLGVFRALVVTWVWIMNLATYIRKKIEKTFDEVEKDRFGSSY